MCNLGLYTFILEYVIFTPKQKNFRVSMACTSGMTYTWKIVMENGGHITVWSTTEYSYVDQKNCAFLVRVVGAMHVLL